MNFYFSLFELMETVDHLEKDIQHLASRALRISPRDARANRELLEQCEMKIRETRLLLNNNFWKRTTAGSSTFRPRRPI